MISTDPPAHERLRGFANERFQPGALKEYRPRLEELTDEPVDELEEAGEFDFLVIVRIPNGERVTVEVTDVQ